MDKQNIFKSCSFHANKGDVVHVLVKDLTGAGFTVSLNDGAGAEEDTYSLTTTVAPPILPLLDKSGNEYTTVIIGAQEWIVENFKSTIYADDATIPNLTANGDWLADVTGAYCWYNNDIGYKTPYGALYNWHAVNNAHGLAYLERGGVLEAGWRVPTNIELAALVTYFGGDTIAGGPLKEIGNIHWDINVGATNSSGLTFVGAGARSQADGSFGLIKEYTYNWSGNEQDVDYAYNLIINNYSIVVEVAEYSSKIRGVSVRLVRDVV